MNHYIPTKKELYISIFAASAGVLILVFSIIIVTSMVSSINNELSLAESTALGIEKTFSIKKDLADWQNEIHLLGSFFVGARGEVDFIEKLEAVGRSLGVKIEINSIAVGKKSTAPNFTESLNMKVHFEGEWARVAGFLKSVEQMPYAVSVGNVSMNLVGGPLWTGDMDVSVLKMKDI